MAHISRRELRLDGRASGEPLRLVVLGSRGPSMTYFSSSGGDELEFERFGMQHVCAAWLGAGLLRIVAVDARGPRTFWDDRAPARRRIERYAALQSDLLDALMPFLHELAGESRLTLVGSSYGAYVATNLWLDRPDEVGAVCGLGGVYGLRHRLAGVDDPLVARHTPLERVPALRDEEQLRALRATDGVTVYAAADDSWLPSSRSLVAALAAHSIPHAFDLWPSPADHHERWWRDQLLRFVRRRLGEPR